MSTMTETARALLLMENNSWVKLRILKKMKKKRKRVHEIYRDRLNFGEFHHLYQQLRSDENAFRQYTRMTPATFDYILEAIRDACYHCPTNFQDPITVEERLFLTLRYLSTGVAFRQIAFSFRISKSSVASIVIEVCKAIWNSLQKNHMPIPNVNSFRNISRDFCDKWNFPNCIGSIDGKHIRLRCPSQSGSMFYNYKQFYSVVLMAIVDAKYRFIMIDVGAYGKDSDAGVFSNSPIYRSLTNGSIHLPEDMQLPNSDLKAPFVFVGDEAFPLRTYLMRPYPRRRVQENTTASYFNYRLSRARMTVECAFGISSARFRILLKAIETKVENAVHIVKAVCILHNTIIDMERDLFINVSEVNNSTRKEGIRNLNVSKSNNRPPREAETVRDIFSQYFSDNKI